MATSNLILNATDSFGKSIAKTITNLNPDVNSDTAKTFAQMLNGFTTNTYVSTNRVDKANVDTEATGSTPDTRPTPTLTLESSSGNKTVLEGGIVITYDGDGDLRAYTDGYGNFSQYIPVCIIGNPSNRQLIGAGVGGTGTVKVIATGTANYKPVEVTFTVTA